MLPNAHAEFYAEFYKEDYPGEFHVSASSLVDKPDDYSAYNVGFQRVFSASDHAMRVLHVELVNGEIAQNERGERGFEAPFPPYIHNIEIQGHTYDGLILGSPEAYGGEGFRMGIDTYTPSGRQSIAFERALRFDWLPTDQSDNNVHPDVLYDLRFEIVRFHGGRDYELTLIPAIDLNRNLVANSNVANLTVAVTTRGWP